MKMRIILSILFIIFSIFIIYIFNIDNKIYYFNVMDKNYDFDTYNILIKNNIKNIEKYVNIKNNDDYRVTDFIRDIDDNKKIENKYIQNILIKADVITIKLGNNELDYKKVNTNMNELFDYSDELINDIRKLIQLLRKYSKEEIFFINFENTNEFYNELYSYLNIRVEDICKNYNVHFINTNNQFDEQNNVKIYQKIMKKI